MGAVTDQMLADDVLAIRADMLGLGMPKDTCADAAWIVLEVARYFGIEAIARSVNAYATNRVWLDYLEQGREAEAFKMGTSSSRGGPWTLALKYSPDNGRGHVIVELRESEFLILDPSIDQLHRLHKGIDDLPPVSTQAQTITPHRNMLTYEQDPHDWFAKALVFRSPGKESRDIAGRSIRRLRRLSK